MPKSAGEKKRCVAEALLVFAAAASCFVIVPWHIGTDRLAADCKPCGDPFKVCSLLSLEKRFVNSKPLPSARIPPAVILLLMKGLASSRTVAACNSNFIAMRLILLPFYSTVPCPL